MLNNMTRKTRIKLIVMGIIVGALVLWQTAYWLRLITIDQIGERSRHTLNLIVQTLHGDLLKFRYLPQMLGENERFKNVFRSEASPANLKFINEELERITAISGALDAYLMDVNGLTIAASNPKFIGKNFDYRPYFQAAMQGRLGRYFALGTMSQERGYYFAYPVRDNGHIIGAVVIKIQVGHHEKAWQEQNAEVIVVDKSGVIFLSSEPSWNFHTLAPLPENLKSELKFSKRYRNQPLDPLPVTPNNIKFTDGEIIAITTKNGTRKTKETYLIEEENMADAELRVLLLANTKEVNARVRTSVATAAIFLISLLLAGIAIYERRRRIADRIAVQDESNIQLEKRVLERTNALSNVNSELKNEITERKRAEEEVRKAQVTLIQTAKLAALGQMSAGLSHELNQPLTAIRSYADNARQFLERKRHDTAKENLKGISELTERMARIIRNLRTYAREETIEVRPTSLGSAVDESLVLLDQRIRSEGVTISNTLDQTDIKVMAGDVRLQQVFVNLLSNAIDALEGQPIKTIYISATFENGNVLIDVKDTGPGIDEEQIVNVFDPFYSSKEVGKGMGLGLSITLALVHQFGGAITAQNGSDGGAIFTLRLKRAELAKEAAVQ